MKVLIVGAGVTGVCLAHEFLQHGASVKVIDSGQNVSSIVAAGLMTPLVFRRMTLSWRIAEMLPFAQNTYRKIEEITHSNFFHNVAMRRFFASEQEREFWLEKQEQTAYQPYMEKLTDEDLRFPSSKNNFGTARVKNVFWVNTSAFLNKNYAYFNSIGVFEKKLFNYNDLDPETATFEGETYDFVLFAEGKDALKNPYFSYLPINPTKGEVLTIQSDEIPENESLNRKCFLLPVGGNQFKVGSTYVWQTDDTSPTDVGKNEICENLTSIVDVPYKIVEHTAGVRPTVLDRRPLMGKHSTYPKLVVANGLGTKGYLIAPLLVHELVDHLLNNNPLNKEIEIARLKAKN